MSDYWKEFWSQISGSDAQSQVGRTVKKQPISDELFEKTLDWVAEKMQINENSSILELCCGNGVWTLPYSKRVKHITAVDFSEPLLDVLKKRLIEQKITNVDVRCEDVSVLKNRNNKCYTHISLFFAIQHFSEREVILLFESAYNILKKDGGIFYIEGIPDRQKLWDFACTKEYEKMYFDSVKNATPAIGTWFMKDDLVKLADYAGFSSSEIVEKPNWQINSNFRFDMKMEVY